MTTIKWRAISALMLSAGLAILFWLKPDLDPGGFASVSPMVIYGLVFAVFWLYLVVQGYPLSHGNIGSSSAHNLDNMISATPALVAIIAVFLRIAGFVPLSGFNIVIAIMTLLVAVYDLWILGGAAAKINRLTDEYKAVS
jgi:hypothetical protein